MQPERGEKQARNEGISLRCWHRRPSPFPPLTMKDVIHALRRECLCSTPTALPPRGKRVQDHTCALERGGGQRIARRGPETGHVRSRGGCRERRLLQGRSRTKTFDEQMHSCVHVAGHSRPCRTLALLVAMMSSKLMPKRASKLKGAEGVAIFFWREGERNERR